VGGQDANLELALEQAQAGDARGIDALYRAFDRSVVGYLRARNVSDPDGIANEVFLRAFRTIHTFRGDTSRFRSWLFTIAHNAAIDDARRRRRRVNETALDRAPEAADGDVEADVMTRIGTEQIEVMLGGLSSDQREVLVLRIVADLSVEQTAAAVGKSYEAVKALQRRGLAALRRALAEHEAVPG
jgi:RNA polymerase sigma factor (sigma-70 family)